MNLWEQKRIDLIEDVEWIFATDSLHLDRGMLFDDRFGGIWANDYEVRLVDLRVLDAAARLGYTDPNSLARRLDRAGRTDLALPFYRAGKRWRRERSMAVAA